MKIEKPREGKKFTIKYCDREGVPNPPCGACSKPCEGEHLKTETRIFKDGKWELDKSTDKPIFKPSYEPVESVDGKLRKFTIKKEK